MYMIYIWLEGLHLPSFSVFIHIWIYAMYHICIYICIYDIYKQLPSILRSRREALKAWWLAGLHPPSFFHLNPYMDNICHISYMHMIYIINFYPFSSILSIFLYSIHFQEQERSLESLVIGGVAAAIFLIAVALILVTLNLKQTNIGGGLFVMICYLIGLQQMICFQSSQSNSHSKELLKAAKASV